MPPLEPKDRKFISDAISNLHDLKAEIHRDKQEIYFQLALQQIDLLKTLASLMMGIAALGYIYKENANLDDIALGLGFIFGLITLVSCLSGTRESIDTLAKVTGNGTEGVDMKVKEAEEVAFEAIGRGNFELFRNFAEENGTSKLKPNKTSLDYRGELIMFLFYLSLGFFILSFIPELLPENYMMGLYCRVLAYLIVIELAFILSFYDWFEKGLGKINHILNKLARKD